MLLYLQMAAIRMGLPPRHKGRWASMCSRGMPPISGSLACLPRLPAQAVKA